MAPRRTVSYRLVTDLEGWYRWRRTIPRHKSIADRIEELLDADREGRVGADLPQSVAEAYDALEADAREQGNSDRVALIQIRRAAMRASQALADDGGVAVDDAREEIRDITNTVESAL